MQKCSVSWKRLDSLTGAAPRGEWSGRVEPRVSTDSLWQTQLIRQEKNIDKEEDQKGAWLAFGGTVVTQRGDGP